MYWWILKRWKTYCWHMAYWAEATQTLDIVQSRRSFNEVLLAWCGHCGRRLLFEPCIFAVWSRAIQTGSSYQVVYSPLSVLEGTVVSRHRRQTPARLSWQWTLVDEVSSSLSPCLCARSSSCQQGCLSESPVLHCGLEVGRDGLKKKLEC